MPSFKSFLTARTPLYILIIPILVIYALLLSACTASSPVQSNLHLLKISTPGASDEARIGYFGLCAGSPSNLLCSASYHQDASMWAFAPASIVNLALSLQSSAFYPLLAGSGVLFALAVLLFLLAKHVLGKSANGQRKVMQVVFMLLWVSLAFAVAQAIGVDMATKGMEVMGTANVDVEKGQTAMALLWCIVGAQAVFVLGLQWVLRRGFGGGEE